MYTVRVYNGDSYKVVEGKFSTLMSVLKLHESEAIQNIVRTNRTGDLFACMSFLKLIRDKSARRLQQLVNVESPYVAQTTGGEYRIEVESDTPHEEEVMHFFDAGVLVGLQVVGSGVELPKLWTWGEHDLRGTCFIQGITDTVVRRYEQSPIPTHGRTAPKQVEAGAQKSYTDDDIDLGD